MAISNEDYSVAVENVIKIFRHRLDNTKISALRGCDLFVKHGEIVSIIGPSGAGKSTLLNVIAGIEKPSSGQIFIGNIEIQDWTDMRRREFRRRYLSIFSQHPRENFDPRMKVHEALRWELINAQWHSSLIENRIEEILNKLEIINLKNTPCGMLSAGEAMRVSLAKAVVKKPFVILADEPTGQLDTENMQLLYKLVKEIVKDGTAFIVATHDVRFQTVSDRSLLILDGRLAGEEDFETLFDVKEHKPKDEKESTISKKLILDSTDSLRIPPQIKKRLNVSRFLNIRHEPQNDFVTISKHESDPGIPEEEVIEDKEIEIMNFTRERILDHSIIEVNDITKFYGSGNNKNVILENFDLSIKQGEFCVLLGPSGIGKTTLMNIIVGIEKANDGEIIISKIEREDHSKITKLDNRFKEISYLTQNYILHPYISVEENILLPRLLNGHSKSRKTFKKIREVLQHFEMEMYKNVFPTELSGGQQQRIALAAALFKNTEIILADEPTANLDSRLAKLVMNTLTDYAESGRTLVVATHDLTQIRPGYRVIKILDKQIIEDVIADEAYCEKLKDQFSLIKANQ
ncbi:MAG: putative ABC transporter ATP-binding protein [Candidatus Heimdallarchaeota archaeon LC_2]|nr:MAG: putative ABC transporter ATP-binding protein [Candidatus Heimdallarchaeota archaeon LC_2]OLS21495.1 MAG: putative ABC transporter ATP-binding protein [Candidatus Heimdallarchaeota archaeon LC_2]